MRQLRLTAAVSCAALMALSVAAAGSATATSSRGGTPRILNQAGTKADDGSSSKDEQRKQKREALNAAITRGAADTEIEKSLGLRRVKTRVVKVDPGTGRASSTIGSPTLTSDNSEVSVPPPYMYSEIGTGELYVSANFSWDYIPSDALGSDRPIGGPDGWGVRFSEPVQNLGSSLQIQKGTDSGFYYPDSFYATNYASNSEIGVGWTFQDRGYSWFDGSTGRYLLGHNAAYGYSTTTVRRLDFESCLQAFAVYSHTWDVTSVTGIGASNWGFDISWSTTSDHWERFSDGASEC